MSKRLALAELAQSYAICNGLIMKIQKGNSYQVEPIPFTLTPTSISKKAYDKVVYITPILNALVDKMSRDSSFINQSLESVAHYDNFVKKLLEIYNETFPKTKSSYQLSIHRSDYMLHVEDQGKEEIPQQVELNTISSAFGALSPITHKLHSYLQKYVPEEDKIVENEEKGRMTDKPLLPNNSFEKIVDIMNASHNVFLSSKVNSKFSKFYVLFIVQEGERNIGDQKPYELSLVEKYGVFVIRRTLQELVGNTNLVEDSDNEQPTLVVDGKYPISVVYFRSGYSPDDYVKDEDWEVRRQVEYSSAIKCPSVGIQLVGTKKIQQVMYNDSVLEKYLNKQDVKAVKEVFTGIYSLEEENLNIIKDAIEHEDDYVLKPQREGGGNLVYGEKMKSYLEILVNNELKSTEEYNTIKYTYILMKKIKPRRHYKEIVRKGEISSGECISELGIYCIHLGNDSSVVVNTNAGYLLRTKLASHQDGGVASGVASMDSIYLE
ncbi:hypothetical protein ABK040_013774 [Willaertia magna]